VAEAVGSGIENGGMFDPLRSNNTFGSDRSSTCCVGQGAIARPDHLDAYLLHAAVLSAFQALRPGVRKLLIAPVPRPGSTFKRIYAMFQTSLSQLFQEVK
jgi:hypothetical protein